MIELYSTIATFGSVLKKTALFKPAKKSLVPGLALCIGLLSGTANKAQAQVSLTASAGTTSATYTTLNSAFAAINAGTHTGLIAITITSNTTEPATPIPLLASGTAGSSYSGITIMPSGNVTINSDAAPAANRGIIELSGADNVTIDGDDPLTAGAQNLSIVAASVTTAGVACVRLSSNSTTGTDGANNNNVKNCIIIGSRSSATSTVRNFGIQFSDGTGTSSYTVGAYSSINTLIQNNVITKCYYGINAIGNSATYLNTGTKILNNTIGNATATSYVAFRGIAISYTSSTAGSSSALIEGNDIRVGHTSGSNNQYAIEVATTNAGIKITKNNIHDCINPTSGVWGMYGVGISSSTNNAGVIITNNFIRDISGYAVSSLGNQYGGYGVYIGADATGIVINNNTIVQQASGLVGGGIFVNSSGATIAQCLNNIVVVNAPSQYSCAFYTVSTSNISSATVNNNNYYVTSPSILGYYNGASTSTLLNWQTATGKDGLTLNENPVFASSTDLHIPNNSITFLESAGASIATTGVNVDIDNQTRPGASSFGFGTAPDIGADEFDGNVVYTCATPNPGATVASNLPLCLGSSTTLSLSNPTTGTGVTYQWQACSTLGGTYVDSVGAVMPTYTIVPKQGAYYRCKVTCANGPATTISTPVQVTFAYNVTSTTPNFRCGTGSVILGATTPSGTLNWYPTASGGASLGSGTSFNSPAISATTTFYVGSESNAPGTATLGTGTGLNSTSTSVAAAYPSYYGNGRQQYLILASELSAMGLAAGNITSISFNVTSIGDPATLNGYSIKMAPTAATTIAAAFLTPTFTNVWGASNYLPTIGVNTHTFTTPFNWDGSSNVLVDICFSNSVTGNSSTTTYQTNSGFNSSICYYADGTGGAGACTSTTVSASSQLRPNMTFAGTIVCSSPRIPVLATVNTAPALTITPSQTICNNAITPLNVTSNLSSYNTYVWSPVTDLYTNAAATVPYTASSNATSVYLKSATANAGAVYTMSANNTSTLCAQVAKDTITILPGTVSATSNTAYGCMSASSLFTLTPSSGYGTASFQWQSSSNNTSFTDIGTNATNITYTTPVVNTTTYYRATIKNGAGTVCLNSSSDTVRVYNPLVSGTTPAARCGPGTLTLNATGVDGSLNWYASSTGNDFLATGNAYTTPSLSATTTYYVEAQSPANAIVSGVIGSGGTTMSGSGSSPFAGYYEGARTQYLITAAQLTNAGITAGNLTSLSFNVSNKYSSIPYLSYTISLAPTSVTSLTGIETPTFTPVYGPTSYSSVLGANTFNFIAPYTWNGTSNLLVDICFSNDPASTGILYTSNDEVTATNTSYASTYGFYQDNSALCGATTTTGSTTTLNTMPVMIFTQPCVSPRLPVVATVNTVPTAGISPTNPAPICAGNTTTLTGTGAGTGTYQWRNAAGNIAGATNSTYTTGVSGAYRVYVTTAQGCTDTSIAVNLVVNPLPVVNLGNDTTFCSGSSLILNAGTSGNAYLWDNNSTTQTRVVNTSGNYSVRVTNSFNCIKRDTILVTVNPTPGVDIGIDAFVCTGVSYTMNAGNVGATYLWDNNSTAQTRTVNTSGTYYVKVTNGFNCSKRDTAIITYLVSPIVNLGADISACVGDVVSLNAGNPGNLYLWDNNTTQQTRNVTTSGTYNVRVTNAANCHGYDTISVNVHPLPVVNLGSDIIICHGEETTLNAGNPGSSYLWNDNSTLQTLVVNTTGDYNVHVTDSHNCVGTDEINVFVKPLPSGIINAIHGDTATYTFNVLNQQFVTDIEWNFGDGSPLVTGDLVQHRYTQNGQYLVSAKLAGECDDSTVSSRTVEVYDVIGGSTGMQQLSNTKDLALYPNPAKDLVMVENLGNLNLEKITVYNIIGQTVYSAKAENKMKHKIDVSRFISGMYTVRIETSGGTLVRKFEILK